LRGLALSETGFVFDPVSGFAYNLNLTAVTLLRKLQDGNSIEKILKFMREEYEADSNEMERDLEQFLNRLSDYGLLSWKKA
jgi:hypothetical protein